MIGALTLLFGAALVATFAPALLRRLLRRRLDPQAVLVVWSVLVGMTFLTTVSMLVIVMLPTHGPMLALMRFAHHYTSPSLHHGSAPVHELIGSLLLIPVAGVLVLLAHGLVKRSRRQRQVHRHQLDLLRIAADPEPGRFTTMWLPHAEPLAYSVAGTPSFVVATQGIRDRLPAADAAAVIEHERAHLRGHHHLLVGVAEAMANSAPWIPLMRHSPGLVRAAVELAADRVAARAHGATAVRTALLTMTDRGSRAPDTALGMSEDHIDLRLSHLETSGLGSSPAKRALGSGLAGLTAAALLALVGAGLLFAVVTLFCGVLLAS